MSIDDSRELYKNVQELTALLAELGIMQLEVVASGKPPRYLVSGFAADAAAEARSAEALAALGPEAENTVLPVACRRSGPAPTGVAGDPLGSPRRAPASELPERA